MTLSKSVILKEQDSKEVLKRVSNLVHRVARLYQIPSWNEESSVTLAEWICNEYRYEALESVEDCLMNPPSGDGKTWRLTPDTIREWMLPQLEKAALELERENAKYKEQVKEPLPKVDYESFKKRLESGEALKDHNIPNGFGDEGYLKYKAERAKQIALRNKPSEDKTK